MHVLTTSFGPFRKMNIFCQRFPARERRGLHKQVNSTNVSTIYNYTPAYNTTNGTTIPASQVPIGEVVHPYSSAQLAVEPALQLAAEPELFVQLDAVARR